MARAQGFTYQFARLGLFGFSLALLCSQTVFGYTNRGAGSSSSALIRPMGRLGIELTAMGEPFPCAAGILLNYQIFKPVRMHMGYGRSSGTGVSSVSYGAGMTAFMYPKKTVSPLFKLGYAKVSGLDSGLAFESPPLGINKKGLGAFSSGNASHSYVGVGFEWMISAKKFYIGSGYLYSAKSGIGGWFYANAGFIF